MARGKRHRLRLGFEQLSQLLDRLNRGALPDVTTYFGSIAALLRLKRRQLDEEACRRRAAHDATEIALRFEISADRVSQLIQQQLGLTRKESL